MELYIIRHGRTKWNKIKRLQGSTNIPLMEEGREMAAMTAFGLKEVQFDAVYSSPLERAYETARIITGDRDIGIQADIRLKEISFGILEGETVDYVIDETFSKEQGVLFTHPERYVPPEGGESLEALCDRASDFLTDIQTKHCGKDRVLIVAHGAVNKAILKCIMRLDMKDFWSGEVQKNCGVTIINIDGSHYEVIASGKIFYTMENGL